MVGVQSLLLRPNIPVSAEWIILFTDVKTWLTLERMFDETIRPGRGLYRGSFVILPPLFFLFSSLVLNRFVFIHSRYFLQECISRLFASHFFFPLRRIDWHGNYGRQWAPRKIREADPQQSYIMKEPWNSLCNPTWLRMCFSHRELSA